jgi:hypothetical protein
VIVPRNEKLELCCPLCADGGRTVVLERSDDGTSMWTCPTGGCGFMVFRDADGNRPSVGEFSPTPDEELLERTKDLERDEEHMVHAQCVGHPLGSDGGCGWRGKATVSRGKAAGHGVETRATFMPTCPSCGGWAEPEEQSAALRSVK